MLITFLYEPMLDDYLARRGYFFPLWSGSLTARRKMATINAFHRDTTLVVHTRFDAVIYRLFQLLFIAMVGWPSSKLKRKKKKERSRSIDRQKFLIRDYKCAIMIIGLVNTARFRGKQSNHLNFSLWPNVCLNFLSNNSLSAFL